MEDLKERRRYDRLEQEIDKIAKTMEDEHNLEINHEIWTEQLDQLRDLIESEKIDIELEVKKWISGVHESAAYIDDAIFLSAAKLKYTENWEDARLDGQKLRLDIEEQKLNNELNECDKTERVNEIVSGELKAFYESEIYRLEGEMASWTDRYNDDIDKRQGDIENTREELENLKESLVKKQKLVEERQEFIDECVTTRTKIAEEKVYWEDIHGAASIIQALWKGYMVRHQLGPYKGLWKALKKRKKLAAKKRKKLEARRKKMEAKKAAAEGKKRK